MLTAGSGGTNAGTLYVGDNADTFTAGVPTAPYLVMDVGWNLAAPSQYMVPDDYALALSRISVSGDNGKTVSVYAEVLNGSELWERRAELHVGSGSGEFTLVEGLLTARERIRVRGLVSTGTGQIMVLLSGVLLYVPA